MAAAAVLMTVAEFDNLPEVAGFDTELHHGEVVQMSKPKLGHELRVYWIRRVLQPVADERGYLDKEFSYRAVPEHDLRVADLAFVPWARFARQDKNDRLRGAPDFVVEVLSPSNSAEEIQEKKELCLANGCREFWAVYQKLKQIEVSTAESVRMYRMGDTIPSVVFPGYQFAVADLLADPPA